MRRLWFLALSMSLAAVAEARAQVELGAQVSREEDSDYGVGGRLLVGLIGRAPVLESVIAFDWFFPDGPIDVWEANGGMVLAPVTLLHRVRPYVGGGVNVTHTASRADTTLNEVHDTDVAPNLIGGVKFLAGVITPFVEVRATLAEPDRLVFTGGLIFERED